MSDYEADVEELMGRYRRKLADLGGLQARIGEISGTAASARQGVRVTVNAQGEITALEFPTGAYKRMPPIELAEEILATAREAKAKAQQALGELLGPSEAGGSRLLDLVRGTADPGAHFSADPPLLDAVREYIQTGRVPGQAPSS